MWSRYGLWSFLVSCWSIVASSEDPFSLRVAQLPDFVGFSYSRADVQSPSSSRFISFLNENLNINANFLPRYSSFEATRPGVYSFNFAFLSQRNEASIVSLRKNGKILVTAMSEESGFSPVSQATLTYLKPGDKVQLEVIQGRLYESPIADMAYTTFSGWLIGPTFDPNRPIDVLGAKQDNEKCCCSRVCPPNEVFPPFQAPSYSIPPPPPPLPPQERPLYIMTTPKPSYYNPTPGYDNAREDRDKGLDCCDSLLISTTTPRSRALQVQDEKFGVYRIQYVDRSSSGRGRATFKHIDRNLFLYYINDNDVSGWIVGPNPGISVGGLFIRSNALCVEHSGNSGEQWQYFDQDFFLRDSAISISCFVQGYLDGKSTGNGGIVIGGKTHYHRHEHYHYDGDQQPRSIQFGQDHVPAYEVRANSKFVKATFVFPNGGNSSVVASDQPSYLPHTSEDETFSPEIVEVKNDLTNRDGFIVHKNRSGSQED